eukprot:CAMPEP_0184484692 /NCGR_PEP_ID=MMETSP0113_2-20130426/6375_1 /TAXON_ID=91329 /ORGANISM="Norrisiella sphaerica, Strain BC52" /LENGTH=124 /DNA_ID=CAMNT_0026865787 /DNA_START=444 /DNA_END=815 /DNA_ORIENTATION=-
MATAFAKNQEEYRKMRLEALDEEEIAYLQAQPQMNQKLVEGGIGGNLNPNRIRCLHENYAHFLATGSNVIGEEVESWKVIPPCCSEEKGRSDEATTEAPTRDAAAASVDEQQGSEEEKGRSDEA